MNKNLFKSVMLIAIVWLVYITILRIKGVSNGGQHPIVIWYVIDIILLLITAIGVTLERRWAPIALIFLACAEYLFHGILAVLFITIFALAGG